MKSNATHEQIPSDESATDQRVVVELDDDIENNLSEEEEEDELIRYKPFILEDDPEFKCHKRINDCVTVLFFVVSFLAIMKLFFGDFYMEDTTMKKVTYNLNNESLTESMTEPLTDPMMLGASLHSRGAYYRRHNPGSPEPIKSPKCEDYEYGCCEIYDVCGLDGDDGENSSFYSQGINIDPRVIHKHDELGTNCPRFRDMISDYAEAYGSESCEYSEYGCCELNFMCDIRAYFQTYRNETDEYTGHVYRVNTYHTSIMMSTDISQKDERGSNCPKPYNIIHKYETGFRTDEDTLTELCIIFGFAGSILCLFSACSGKRGRY